MYNRFINLSNRLHQVKNIIKNRFKHDSEGRKTFFDVFNSLIFKKLKEIEKAKHQLKNCQECQEKFKVRMNIYVKDTKKEKEISAITPRAQSYVKMCNRNVLIMVVVLPSNFSSAREGKAEIITCLENS